METDINLRITCSVLVLIKLTLCVADHDGLGCQTKNDKLTFTFDVIWWAYMHFWGNTMFHAM